MNALLAGQSVGGGRFLLQHILGQGGMGVVWLAEDKLLRELVALKFLPEQLSCDPASMESLRTETSRSRKLSHPNILRIHDLIDAQDEMIFISMEYVEGANLHVLRAQRPEKVLSWNFMAPLVTQLCAALEHAHGEKVIHRDLKPANLMLDGHGRLKLADFGLAHAISDSISRISGTSRSTSGTLPYMSPQQADGKMPRVTDDVYSLGATLYELLTSRPPFFSGDVAHQVRHIAPQPMSDRLRELGLSNEIPEEVSRLVMACLAKDPAQRPQSASGILKYLDDSSQPNIAPEKTSKRHRYASLAKLAALLAVGIGLTVGGTAKYRHWRKACCEPGAAVPGEPGFGYLFNGKDLKGWDYEPGRWSVREGVISAFAAEEGVVRRENTCLIWKGTVTNFVLRLSFRLRDVLAEKPANSGVIYRGHKVRNWHVRGYQCDLNGPHTGTLILLEDGDDPRSTWGQCVVIKPAGGRPAVQPRRAVTDAKLFKETVRFADWNELEIASEGSHIIHKVNGVVTTEAIDETLKGNAIPGLLALELKRATRLEFKDIRLKRL
ncbi:MAG TPA: protein kinase [Verrucomicrobiae bacterium]|nr:protein kinase [Verrucomicrobiae bacterium]